MKKKGIVFNGGYEKKRYSCRESGVLMLRVGIEYPVFEGEEIYKSLAERCERWATGELLPRIKAEYEQSGDEDKRFRFPPFDYSFCVKVDYENELGYEISVCADLSRRGKMISHNERSHRLLKNGKLAVKSSNTRKNKKR